MKMLNYINEILLILGYCAKSMDFISALPTKCVGIKDWHAINMKARGIMVILVCRNIIMD
jgi:hypothetical protein